MRELDIDRKTLAGFREIPYADDAGFKWPLFMEPQAWDAIVKEYVDPKEAVGHVLRQLAFTIKSANPQDNTMNFTVADQDVEENHPLHIQAVQGPGNKPVLVVRDGTVQEREKVYEQEMLQRGREGRPKAYSGFER